MNDKNDFDDGRPESDRREHALKEDAAPNTIGVYERPEQSTLSPVVIAVIVVVLLLIAAVVAYMLLF